MINEDALWLINQTMDINSLKIEILYIISHMNKQWFQSFG